MGFNLDQIKASNPITEVIGRDLSLRKQGREFVCCCPFHPDKTPSFTIMPDRGRFHCFGCDADGDVIDYVQRKHQVDLPDACRILGGEDEHPMVHPAQPTAPAPKPSTPTWHPVMPVPDDVPAPPQSHARFGKPEHVARVLNQAGELMQLIYRFPPLPGERKQIRPLCFDGKAWQWKGAPAPRPLYGLPLTAGRPVLLVEGEKKRDAAAAALAETYDVVSWQNGADGVPHAAWTTLSGLDVVLWPDADAQGTKAATAIAAALRRTASSFRLIEPPPAANEGWDVADALSEGWKRDDLLRLIDTAQAVRDPDSEPPESDPSDPGPQEQPYHDYSRRSRRTDKGEIQWPVPVDFLAEDEMGVPTLEQRHIPAPLWAFVADTAERMGVDPSGVALGAIVCAASVIDEQWRLQPRRHDYSYTEGARLWGGILGGPSTIKTPQISACSRPIDKLEIRARKQHAEEMQAYETALAEHKRALKAKEPTEEPKRPKLKRYMAEDATVEALSEVLRDQDDPKGRQFAPAGKILVRQDEMAEFFAGLDRYKSGGAGSSDRGAYLRLFNGSRFTTDRVMRGAFSINSWSACFLGGCQPGPIQKIARETADDGLLQRFLWCVPGKQGVGVDRAPDRDAIRRYDDVFPALAAMHPAPGIGATHISPVVLHRDGHAIREEVEAVARAMIAMPDTSKRLQAAFGKWPGIFARLCLTFHMIEIADGKVRQEIGPPQGVVQLGTIECAAAYMIDIVLPHQLRAEALMFSTTQTSHAQWVAGHILSKGLIRVTRTDVTRAYGSLRAPEAAQELTAVMTSLVSIGWLEPEEATNLAKGTHAWLVNPQVHTLFAERAAREKSLRAAARETAFGDVQVFLQTRRKKAAQG